MMARLTLDPPIPQTKLPSSEVNCFSENEEVHATKRSLTRMIEAMEIHAWEASDCGRLSD